jgi:hypothetical protein
MFGPCSIRTNGTLTSLPFGITWSGPAPRGFLEIMLRPLSLAKSSSVLGSRTFDTASGRVTSLKSRHRNSLRSRSGSGDRSEQGAPAIQSVMLGFVSGRRMVLGSVRLLMSLESLASESTKSSRPSELGATLRRRCSSVSGVLSGRPDCLPSRRTGVGLGGPTGR